MQVRYLINPNAKYPVTLPISSYPIVNQKGICFEWSNHANGRYKIKIKKLIGGFIDMEFFTNNNRTNGKLSEHDILLSTATITFDTNFQDLNSNNEVIFRVKGEDFIFELGISKNMFYLERNGFKVESEIANVGSGFLFCIAKWSPTFLEVNVLDETCYSAVENGLDQCKELHKRKDSVNTDFTLIPNYVFQHLRNQAFTPKCTYNTEKDLFKEIIGMLQLTEKKIRDVNMINAFWDRHSTGKSPKMEIDIQPTIHALLNETALLKNLLVIRENSTGSGNLDFLIIGIVDNKMIKVCVEFKHAHSSSREDGLLKQLPEYMRSMGTDFGIYCVLYFKGNSFDKPKEVHDSASLLSDLKKKAQEKGLENIRTLIFDCTEKTSASKL
ncbi:hypothetical protein CN318_29825 [Bacillus cereus]|nr:hypothetical protein CN318_29825 [Bacillus cereus]